MSTDLAIKDFRTNIGRMHDQFVNALPTHITPEKFERVLMNAVQANPDLLAKNRQSLYAAVMKAAAVGLILDGKEAALVSFGSDVTFMPMVGGLMKLARQSGEVKSITTAIVNDADTFEHWIDEEGEHFKHVPAYGEDRGSERLAYAFVLTHDGGRYLEVMDRAAIEKVRAASRSGQKGPWVQWWGEMARKTVFRRLSKRLPSSSDLDRALAEDESDYAAADQVVETVTPFTPRAARPRGLDRVAAAAEPVDAEVVEQPQAGAQAADDPNEMF